MSALVLNSLAADLLAVALENLQTRAHEYLNAPTTELRFEVCNAFALVKNALNTVAELFPLQLHDQRQSFDTISAAFLDAPDVPKLLTLHHTGSLILNRLSSLQGAA